ncbi:MAG: amino acid carrier protein [Phycisphaerales bacterium]|jgi:AGCS family alanine or glycine:cation symporter|nr:amino acid carrier protein [Phycisphaerales bacterium]
MDQFNEALESVNGYIWTNWMLYILLAIGILFTLWSGIAQYRVLTHGVAVTAGKYDDPDDPGAISHFQALSAALSATVGLGNIAGVAIAIAIGGPGAVFWMWVVGIIGMALKSTEVTQSMLFRDTSDPDNPHGGPMFVVAKGLKRWGLGGIGQFIGVLFCLTLLVSAVTGGNMFQAWNVGDITREVMDVPEYLTGLILAVLVAMVILGGIKRIGSVAGVLVPFMCVLYVLIALLVLGFNITAVPDVFALIFRSAFNPAEASGAFVGGTAAMALLWGMKRALFSSESGQGSSPIAHSAAQTSEPVSEGVVAGLEPFIDTIVVCTLTAFVILSTGALTRGEGEAGGDGVFDPIPMVQFHEEDRDGTTYRSWTLGPPTQFTIDTERLIFGKTDLPERTARGVELGGPWKNGDSVFVIAEGGGDNEQTASNRVMMTGSVVLPEEADATPYVRWDLIRSDKKEVAHWSSLIQGGLPTLASPVIYEDYKGATLTAYAINRQFPGLGNWLILIASWLFAISTMISWSYYGEQGIVFLLGEWAVGIYKIIYCALIVVATAGIVTTTKEIGNLSDLGTGLMLWVNIPIMLIFGGTAMAAWHGYFRRLRSGEIKPHDDAA